LAGDVVVSLLSDEGKVNKLINYLGEIVVEIVI